MSHSPSPIWNSFESLIRDIQDCNVCEDKLPFPPNPVLRAHPEARLLIIGQAPGTKVHQTGLPFNDKSGDRLREWLQMDRALFYDETKIAFMPMGLCYPGKNPKGGDLPPCKKCAPTWHAPVRAFLPRIQLTLLVGQYSQAYYLKEKRKSSMTETVRSFQDYLPGYFPLPHPSWRNTHWIQKNPWFEKEVIICLRTLISRVLRR